MSLSVIIMAAGAGKRLGGNIPKPLMPLHDKPVIAHIVTIAKSLNPTQIIVVVGHQKEKLALALTNEHEQHNLEFVTQETLNGTGGALMAALPMIKTENILVLYADMPLINTELCMNFIKGSANFPCSLITTKLTNPAAFGRIVRDRHHKITAIVEAKDASNAELAVKEINVGIYCFQLDFIKKYLPQLDDNNAQREFYLTDLIRIAVTQNLDVYAYEAPYTYNIKSFNTIAELSAIDKEYQLAVVSKLQQEGVQVIDPNRIDVRGNLQIGADSIIDINVIFKGTCTIGKRVKIGPNCILNNVVIADDTVIDANSMIEDSVIGSHNHIGPYARMRAGCKTDYKVAVGNFVELKNAQVGISSKAKHLSYLGDVTIGSFVNIGAGVITCNYDGKNKFRTKINDKAFIGSNSELIAPLTIGVNAVVGAGTTLNYNVPDNALAISKKQKTLIPDWVKQQEKQVE